MSGRDCQEEQVASPVRQVMMHLLCVHAVALINDKFEQSTMYQSTVV